MSAKAIMVLGTASHVGKSLLTAGICRILSDDGYRVAPFKAQNMSLNSAATIDGLEIGRAQAMQAEAARVVATVDMNPILLKPSSELGSQVVLLGQVAGHELAENYHQRRMETYFPTVCEAYARLAAEHDYIVLEGAGSPAEINLKATDIVNMRMAKVAQARCLLVGDIDRGGVFAALLGTMALLDAEEKDAIAAFAINKFRGNRALLEPGVREISARLALPSAGVIPWLAEVGLDEEDGVAHADRLRVRACQWETWTGQRDRPLRIAVVALPFLANATDFAALDAESTVQVAYAETAEDLRHADVVILPGTKTTVVALQWLRERGFERVIRERLGDIVVLGICGGMQMLGLSIDDPHAVEGGGSEQGMGLLPLRTIMAQKKLTQLVQFQVVACQLRTLTPSAWRGQGYEIHMGRSQFEQEECLQTNGFAAKCEAFAEVQRADGSVQQDGAVANDGRIIGTYLHGIFVHDQLRWDLLTTIRRTLGLLEGGEPAHYQSKREANFQRLAEHLRTHLDLSHLVR